MRRLGSMFYDSLLLLSLFFFATLILLPFTGGLAITSGNIPYHLYLMIISYLYFTWHWSYGGQTLGMRAWHLRLYQEEGRNISWYRASLRFLASILSWLLAGSGFLWSIFDRDSMTLHDRLSKTFLMVETRPGSVAG